MRDHRKAEIRRQPVLNRDPRARFVVRAIDAGMVLQIHARWVFRVEPQLMRTEGCASSAQIALSDTPLPLGTLILPSVGSVQVAPKSSDRLTIAPQCSLLLPIRIRGEPPSMKAADQADCPGKCGPDILKSPRVRSLRKMNAPLTVPTISRRSPDRGESFAVVLMIASLHWN